MFLEEKSQFDLSGYASRQRLGLSRLRCLVEVRRAATFLEVKKPMMAWFSRDKERERYYLLPGMGGRAHRRKHKTTLIWAMVAGLFVSATVAAVLYWLNSLSLTGQ